MISSAFLIIMKVVCNLSGNSLNDNLTFFDIH